MKLTKYWYISLFILFSCQENKIISENEQIKNNLTEIKTDSLFIADTVKKDSGIVYIKEDEIIKKTNTIQIDEKPILEETFESEPDEEYKLPKERYYKFIKSKKFYDDSVKFYNWFMNSEYWRKKNGYPDSTEYYNHYLKFWKDRVNTIKSNYDWSE